jgi:CDP-glucose 4,6-dehydratase
MESVGMTLFGGVYTARRVLVTGHTGFKGSWLATWLSRMGSEVTGLSLPADTSPNHWDLLRLPVSDLDGDIRDIAAVQSAIRQSRPEIVFHLAAQPLVRRSYREPLETWSTNVLGTANVLEACRTAPDLRAIVIVTTDEGTIRIAHPRRPPNLLLKATGSLIFLKTTLR